MNNVRQSRIEYLKALAAGKLAPADLLKLLPERIELFVQSTDGMFHVGDQELTIEEIRMFKSKYPGPVRKLIIKRRSCANARDNGVGKGETTT